MKPFRIRYIAAVCFLWIVGDASAYAQYYSDGQEPFSTRWMESRNDRYRLIYPQGNETDARRVGLVLDTSYRALHYGFSRPAMRLPIILRTQNLRSNGIVIWTPRRSELITTPQTETFAMPWLKQLAVHEYRHVVQMSNLNRHTIKAFSYILGEQALGASAIFVPKWFLEGDAVLAETAMGTYGRALQPEFTLAYRAYLAEEGIDQFSLDKWYCGSYKDFIPNHYYYGYQLTNASYKKYGADFWEVIFDHISRHPYQLFPRPIAFKKYYGTTSGELFRETFGNLKAMWDALPAVEESMRIIPTPTTSYTLYSHPLLTDGGKIIAHKYDFTRTGRLVEVDPATGDERVLTYTGALSSRPVRIGGELLWTEYRPSTFWELKNRSVIRRMPVDGSARPRSVALPGNLFYVTPYRDGQVAAVSYDPVDKYAIVVFDAGFQEIRRLSVPDDITVHGMAWDEETNTLALITLSEEGMGLTEVRPDRNGFSPITPPSFVTINHLTAGGGKLFYNSIRSGKDESHYYDLAEQADYRLSASAFGTVMPSVDASGETLVQATYRRGGYLLSTQKLSETEPEHSPWLHRPVNLVNPEVYDPGLPNLDDMELYRRGDAGELPAKRYRRGTHLFKLHSWAPVSFNVLEAADANDRNLDFNLGVTVLSQNDLSDTEGYLSYGYVDGHNWWRGGLRFLALAPKFEINAEYDGGLRRISTAGAEVPLPEGWDKKYFSVEGKVYLPFNFSSGAMLRYLTPAVTLTHYNSMLYRPEAGDFIKGFQQSEVSLSYSQTMRMAYRDLAPRWGFGLKAEWAAAPFDDSFGSLWSFYGNAYLPGLAANHSLRLRGVYQTQDPGTYHFGSNILFPRGISYNFAPEKLGAVLADYRFPVAYPDWGIDEVIYIKRITANVFGGYARYNPFSRENPGWRTVYSYGAEFSIDFSPLRMTGAGFVFRAALYKSSDKEPLNISAGLSINL